MAENWIKDTYDKDAIVAGVGIEHNVFYPRPSILNDITGYKVMGIFRGFDYKGDSDLINALNIVAEKISGLKPIIVCSKDTFKGLKEKNDINFDYIFFESPR